MATTPVTTVQSNCGPAPTIRAALKWGRESLAAVSATAGLDTELLLAHCIDRDRAWLRAHDDVNLTAAQGTRFRKLTRRRQVGEPVAHITGSCGFWTLDLRVTRDTLVPRPETEVLVEQALARIPTPAAWRIADLGTGCGAIALAIAAERSGCRVTATDVSATALDIARHNGRRLGFTHVEFRRGDWFAAVASQRFDMIIANPPYVAQDSPYLDTGGLQFEPRLALLSGAQGLDALQIIIAGAAAHLEPGGWLMVEHGCDQAGAVRRSMLRHAGRDIETVQDYAGLDRVSACRFGASGAA